jgi:hypothetical protein
MEYSNGRMEVVFTDGSRHFEQIASAEQLLSTLRDLLDYDALSAIKD